MTIPITDDGDEKRLLTFRELCDRHCIDIKTLLNYMVELFPPPWPTRDAIQHFYDTGEGNAALTNMMIRLLNTLSNQHYTRDTISGLSLLEQASPSMPETTPQPPTISENR